MSKASEYAARVTAKTKGPKAPKFEHFWGTATVTANGFFYFVQHCMASGENALALADWIYDTFGDEPREGKK